MGLGIVNPQGHPDDDPNLRVPGTHVFWKSEHAQQTDSQHIVLIPTVILPNAVGEEYKVDLLADFRPY
jgi:hypothetical protein